MEISKEVKEIIINQEIQAYSNTKYQLSLRYKVQKAIGGTPEQLKMIEDELVKIEQAIDILTEELNSL